MILHIPIFVVAGFVRSSQSKQHAARTLFFWYALSSVQENIQSEQNKVRSQYDKSVVLDFPALYVSDGMGNGLCLV